MSAPTQQSDTPAALPQTMRAVVLTGHGGFDRLSFREDWPLPRPGSGQALIAVGACGLNNTDVNTRTAWYSAGVAGATTGEAFEAAAVGDATWGGNAITFPRIQGADVCGRVVAVGGACDASLVGRRALIDPGCGTGTTRSIATSVATSAPNATAASPSTRSSTCVTFMLSTAICPTPSSRHLRRPT